MLEAVELQCPYCWEAITLSVDPSVAQQDYIEDCPVCCKPIRLRVEIDADGRATVTPSHEDDTGF